MFGDLENFYDDEETLELLRRYKDMQRNGGNDFFDLYEFENIIDYYIGHYNFKDALKVVGLAIKQYPFTQLLKLRHAQLLIETGKPAGALRILKNISAEGFPDHELYLAKGFAYNMTGRFAEAQQSFRKAIRFVKEQKDEVAYSIAQSYLQFGMFSEAVRYLLLAYHYNKNNILVLHDLGMSFERLDNYEKSITWYNKYLDIDPFAEHVWNNLGLIWAQQGNVEKACEAFDYSISINPQFIPAYFCKADLFVMNNMIGEAVEVYNDLLSEDSSNIRALCGLANCHVQTGNYQEALRLFKHSLDISSDCADALYGSGIVYYRQKKYQLCIAFLKKAISIEDDVAEYWLMLGEAYNRTRQLSKAIDAYTRASELNPDDTGAKFACAQALFRKRRIHDAIYILMRVYECEPDNARVNYYLAAYYAYQQNMFEAQRFLKRALYLNYKGHTDMFRHFPKTRSMPAFRKVIENYIHKSDPLLKLWK